MAAFEPPWEYSFPPFYTLQRHEETKKRQLSVWADKVLKYHRSAKKNKLNVASNSSVFVNEAIGRKTPPDLIGQVIAVLQENGYLHPLDKEGIEWNICWHTIDEYADMIYSWAVDNGQLNTVCTLYELSSAQPEFSEVDEEILLKSLHKLETRGKCEVINLDGSYGVKFF